MSNIWLFFMGIIAFFAAVGPLMVAFYLDYKEQKDGKV